MHIENIKNYLQISAGIASSGQPEGWQFRHIAQAGYQVVINLAMPNSNGAVTDEGRIVTSLDMTYVHIPVPFEEPNADHLLEFIRVMNALSCRKVWVHCMLNYRVSAFLYQYYRLSLGAPVPSAIKGMLACWEPNAVWQRFMVLSHEDVNGDSGSV